MTQKGLTIRTATVEIKVLQIDNRKLTIATFKQFPFTSLRDLITGTDPEIWGYIRWENDLFYLIEQDGVLSKLRDSSLRNLDFWNTNGQLAWLTRTYRTEISIKVWGVLVAIYGVRGFYKDLFGYLREESADEIYESKTWDRFFSIAERYSTKHDYEQFKEVFTSGELEKAFLELEETRFFDLREKLRVCPQLFIAT